VCQIFFPRELCGKLGIIGWSGNGFHPLIDIVNRKEDIKIGMVRRKGSHEVNPPFVKQLHLKNATLRHLMLLRNVPHYLASITIHDKVPFIFEESGPTESYLEYLYNSLVQAKVSIISREMIMV